MSRTGAKKRSPASGDLTARKASGGGVKGTTRSQVKTAAGLSKVGGHTDLAGKRKHRDRRDVRRRDEDIRQGLDKQWSKTTTAAADRIARLASAKQAKKTDRAAIDAAINSFGSLLRT